VYTHLTPTDARKLLQASADGTHKCRDPLDPTLDGCGAGLLDVDAAMVLAQQAQENGGFDSHVGNVVTGGCSVGGGGRDEAGAIGLVALALLALARALVRRRVL
jgi:MYXO-CTERM domain-containing protein